MEAWAHLAAAVVEQAVADLDAEDYGIRVEAAAWLDSADFALFAGSVGADPSDCRAALRTRGLLPVKKPVDLRQRRRIVCAHEHEVSGMREDG